MVRNAVKMAKKDPCESMAGEYYYPGKRPEKLTGYRLDLLFDFFLK